MGKPETELQGQYLGDGVYASFDGFQIWLDLKGQDPITRIALEPATMSALKAYERDCYRYSPSIICPEVTWAAIVDTMVSIQDGEEGSEARLSLTGHLHDMANWIRTCGAIPYYRKPRKDEP